MANLCKQCNRPKAFTFSEWETNTHTCLADKLAFPYGAAKAECAKARDRWLSSEVERLTAENERLANEVAKLQALIPNASLWNGNGLHMEGLLVATVSQTQNGKWRYRITNYGGTIEGIRNTETEARMAAETALGLK